MQKPSRSSGGFLIGNVCILLATIFWGVNVSVTKALIPDWMTANGIAAVRLIGGAVLLWLTSLFVRCDRIKRGDWPRLVLGGVVGLFLFIFLFVTSLRYGNPIDISIIMTLPPVFVILIGVIFQHRRPSMLEYVGVAVSFAGAVTVILAGQGGKNGSDNLLGDILAVASTLCYAFYLVILERPSATYRPVTMLRWVFLFAAIPGLLLLPGMQHLPILHTAEATPWIEIGFILLCPTFIAYFLVQPAIKNIGSELVSLYQYLLPAFATISAVLMGLDKLKWIQVLAMAIIIAGMVLTNIGKRRKQH
ncbi:DMT family transporter [Duncaniella muricolitica]|jgi:drug/metabolite transporter (DMT)-like permease|uniref:DMT family transporter n=1 Tax=Duncaniella muricolitica TaxID=2880704 RepID=UPI00244D9B42|nr:DMT family transporter [Duncaniella muricolitica]